MCEIAKSCPDSARVDATGAGPPPAACRFVVYKLQLRDAPVEKMAVCGGGDEGRRSDICYGQLRIELAQRNSVHVALTLLVPRISALRSAYARPASNA